MSRLRLRFSPLLLLPLLLAAGGVAASGAAPAARAETSSTAPAAAEAQVKTQPTAGADGSIDRVRELLSERFGARQAGAKTGPYDLKLGAAAPVAPAAAAKPRRPARPAEPEPVLPEHWSYAGAGGPAAWARMNPEYSLCGSGTRQSPIDIRDGVAVPMQPVQFDYRQTAFRVIDTGHTVQVNVEPGHTIEVMGRRYELQQFHFHRPSEELIDGRRADMSLHLVHRDAEGREAVVAVLLEAGRELPLMQRVWASLPLERHMELAGTGPIDLAELLPVDRRYYTYMGSLTTPPCTEGVLWVVMKTTMQVSDPQIDVFSRLYPMNARPIQAASGRLIKESE